MNENLNLSADGLALIKKSEGYRGLVYSDVAGFKTIGYGHRIQPGELFPQFGITEPQACNLLNRDVYDAESAVKRLVRVPLAQGQFDALVDFVFNLGVGRLASSTMLADLNQGKYADASLQLLKWDHVGHVEELGLKERRAAEFNLWQGVKQ